MLQRALRRRQRAEALAANLPPLLVEAERVAATVAQGVHGRRRVGQGETFWQFRHYEPGDQPQLIDWRQSAKSDHVFVRELEWEAAQSVWLWCDTSASMDWTSSEDHGSKRRRAELLALALVVLLVRGGERVALLGSGQPPASGRGTVTRMALQLEHLEAKDSSLPPVQTLPRFAQVVMLSDFLAPLGDIDRSVRRLAESGVRGHLIQILDPAEESLPYEGRVLFQGLEGEDPWLLSRTESVRDDYQNRLQRQFDGLDAITRSTGWSYTRHRSDASAQAVLLTLYAALSANKAL